MKKYILATVVATTVSTMAMADMKIDGSIDATLASGGDMMGTDITGSPYFSVMKAKINFTGKSGNSSFKATMIKKDFDMSTGFEIDQLYAKTSILPGVTVKAGMIKGRNGNGLTQKKGKAKAKYSVATKVAGFTVSASTATANQGVGSTMVIDAAGNTMDSTGFPSMARNHTKLNVSGKFAGVKFKLQDLTEDSRFLTISTTVAGAKVDAELSDTVTALSASTNLGGMSVTGVYVDADSGSSITQDSGILGGVLKGSNEVKAVVVQTATPFGKLKAFTGTFSTKSASYVGLTNGATTIGYTMKEDQQAVISARVKFKF
jgi:hypothetical protein